MTAAPSSATLVDLLADDEPLAEALLDAAERHLLERAATLPPPAPLRAALDRRIRRRILTVARLANRRTFG